MRGIAEDRVLLHAGTGQRQRGPVADTAQSSDRTAPGPLGELAPDFGACTVGAQVIHIDTVLTEQCQHVLRGLHQLGRIAVFQRLAQRRKAFGILGGFGEIQRANEIFM